MRLPRLTPRRSRRRQGAGGFTLLEVMMAMLLAMIGLLGTVAVQQTLLMAAANANDGGIGLRLASQAMEEFNSRVVQPGNPPVDRMAAVATGAWSDPVWLEATGRPSPAQSATARWRRRWRVTDTGLGLPYNISVEVQYALDTGNPKTIQLDLEKQK